MKVSLEDTWMNKKMKKDVKLSPSAIIAVGFLLLIQIAQTQECRSSGIWDK